MSTASVTPRRIRVHDTYLGCDVLRRIGYVARCACGYVGATRDSYDDARRDAREHADAERAAETQARISP